MSQSWSNLARVVYARTYSRNDDGYKEKWPDTVERVIQGNIRNHKVPNSEIQTLRYLMLNRKCGPAGRGLWFSGAPSHERLGGAALNNCWATTAEDWENFVICQDLLMLGGGTGLSVEWQYTSQLPVVKANVYIRHVDSVLDADFVVPDSREGWNELTFRTLEAFFVTGRGFTYSTAKVRPAGTVIKGFGGTASGPGPLITLVEKLTKILKAREARKLRCIDAADILCCIGEMVVSGNVRRSAIIILGDVWDEEYLKAKRWDLGTIPNHRAMANFSVVCDDAEKLTDLFWATYEFGEPFGIVNRANIQRYARMGELKVDTANLVNPCAEACLEGKAKAAEGCNLLEESLPNIEDEAEFELASRMLLRWGKRVTCEKYHIPGVDEIVKRNRRVGIGITGCLRSPLFNAQTLDRVYGAIQDEDRKYSRELGVPESIRTTVVKPSGTRSKLDDMKGYEGVHAALSRHIIQRVRFAANDPLVAQLRDAGHYMEPVIRFDGTLDPNTVVVDFYEEAPTGYPVVDEGYNTWKQLETLKFAQRHWADQAVSVTVYYCKDEIPQIKAWMKDNLQYVKTISFLMYSEHGFKQAPKEPINQETFERLSAKIKPINDGEIVGDGQLDGTECAGGACPIR